MSAPKTEHPGSENRTPEERAFEERHAACGMYWKKGIPKAVYRHAQDCPSPDEHFPPKQVIS